MVLQSPAQELRPRFLENNGFDNGGMSCVAFVMGLVSNVGSGSKGKPLYYLKKDVSLVEGECMRLI